MANDFLAHRSTLDTILSDLRQRLTDNPADVDQAVAAAMDALRNAPAKSIEHETVMAQATKTEYLERLSALYDEQTKTSETMLDLTERLHKNRVAQRELMVGWEGQRRARLLYFDFLYFSFGVATSNTFGDLIPNARIIRYLIVAQLLVSLVLVGLFLNALSK